MRIQILVLLMVSGSCFASSDEAEIQQIESKLKTFYEAYLKTSESPNKKSSQKERRKLMSDMLTPDFLKHCFSPSLGSDCVTDSQDSLEDWGDPVRVTGASLTKKQGSAKILLGKSFELTLALEKTSKGWRISGAKGQEKKTP